jgi:hypothetical protein
VNALGVDIGPVQTAEITQPEAVVPLLDDAMLFGDDSVKQLDGVVRVASDRVGGAKLDRSLPFR